MGTVPTPYDAVALHKLSAAELDAGIKACLDWLLDRYPRVHAFNSASTSIPGTSTFTLIPMAAENYDTDNMHDTTTNTSRIVFNTPGLYEIDFVFSASSGGIAATSVQTRVVLNGAGSASGGSSLRSQDFSDGVRFSGVAAFRFCRAFIAGDYIEFFVSSSGAMASATPSLGTRVFARWIAAS